MAGEGEEKLSKGKRLGVPLGSKYVLGEEASGWSSRRLSLEGDLLLYLYRDEVRERRLDDVVDRRE